MTPMNLPPLAAVRAFEAAARLGGFARAAEELHVTAAAVSHQVRLLEAWLGESLFERHARGVGLTAQGLAYAARVREVLEGLQGATRAVRRRRVQPVVTIRAQFSIAALWLVPRLQAFGQLHPELQLRLQALPFDRGAVRGAVDLAIYQRRDEQPGLVQHPLIAGHHAVYGSPSLLLRHAIDGPRTLARAPLLHTVAAPQTLGGMPMRYPELGDWFAAAGLPVPSPLPGLQFNLEHLTHAACVAGHGCALLHERLAADATRAGQLRRVSGPQLPNPYPYTLVVRENARDEVALVRDWLLAAAAEG